jgi:hypothetical protein
MIVGRPELRTIICDSGGTSLPDQSILDRAWREHDLHRAAIPPAVWRQLRAIKRELAPTAAVIEKLLRDQDLVVIEQVIRRRGVVRQRLLKDFRRALPAATLRLCGGGILEFFWLSPKGPIIVDGRAGEEQDCLLACYAVAYPAGAKGMTLHSGWALEISDHACGRYLQRAPNGDLRTAAQQAALAFVAADAKVITPLIGTSTSIYLPGRSGAFAATVIGGLTQKTGKAKIYARCRTFVPSWDKIGLPVSA